MRVLIAALALIVSGCSSLPAYKAYEGIERAASEISIIKTISEDNHKRLVGLDELLFISEVDGVSTQAPLFTTARYKYPQEAHVLPGDHVIQVFFAVIVEFHPKLTHLAA